MKLNKQLLFKFNNKKNFNYNDFYVTKSNFYAFNLVNNWPKWEKNIINIHGEKFSGKSHLSEIFREKYKAKIFFEKDINENFFKTIKIHENLVLDNFENKTSEKLIYTLFNFVDQDNKYLIINSRVPIVKMSYKLKDLTSRIKTCLLVEISKPDDDLIYALILKYCSDKQIKIDKKLIEYIIKRIDRSYGKIFNFIYKLDKMSLLKKKPIDLKIIKQLI
tara:strand:- start:282 stop:938 length:657 start_codon:yes stop_codon:yes gene_type:complete